MPTSPGVTVAVCCYNSALRLPQTLKNLAAQRVPSGISWEVLVIDNASTDRTAAVALGAWPADSSVPLRVIEEPQPGKSYALTRAFHEASYQLLSVIDDDNWVSADWIESVSAFFARHPEAGAVGGCGSPVFETNEAPVWFEELSQAYAAGPQYAESGDITDLPTSLLWGAGFSMRTEIFRELESRSFQFMCTDRLGNLMLSGGDTELCHAVRAMGWRLYYSSSLHYRHFIPASRLTWSYLRNLYRGAGHGSVYVNIVRNAANASDREGRSWFRQVLRLLYWLIRSFFKKPLAFFTEAEGNPARLQIDATLAQLELLLRIHADYDRLYEKTRAVFRK